MEDELLRLAELCEKADGATYALEIEIADAVWRQKMGKAARRPTDIRVRNFTASIDAALSLAKDVGVLFTLSDIKGGGRPMCVIVSTETAALFEAVADTMPLAVCAASLRALAAMEDAHD